MYGISASNTHKLQSVRNSFTRVVMPSLLSSPSFSDFVTSTGFRFTAEYSSKLLGYVRVINFCIIIIIIIIIFFIFILYNSMLCCVLQMNLLNSSRVSSRAVPNILFVFYSVQIVG